MLPSLYTYHCLLILQRFIPYYHFIIFSFITLLGSEFDEDNYIAKVKMEIVVSKDQVQIVWEIILVNKWHHLEDVTSKFIVKINDKILHAIIS